MPNDSNTIINMITAKKGGHPRLFHPASILRKSRRCLYEKKRTSVEKEIRPALWFSFASSFAAKKNTMDKRSAESTGIIRPVRGISSALCEKSENTGKSEKRNG